MTVKKFFPGNNTAIGFYSLFDDIHSSYKYKFIIKGGPGTGKSSYMKQIFEHLRIKYKTELFYCASDSNSLDGVAFPEIQTIFLDGTHPHVIDPQLPGGGEYLIDLAKYLDREKLISKRNELLEIQAHVKSYYEVTYSYFRQASEALSRQIKLSHSLNNWNKLSDLKSFLIAPLRSTSHHYPIKEDEKNVSMKHVFLRAFTPEGIISFDKEIIDPHTRLFLIEGNIEACYRLLKYIKNYSLFTGHTTEIYLHPLDPDIIEGIRFPQLNIIYLSSNNYPQIKYFKENISYKAAMPIGNNTSPLSQFNSQELKRAIKQQHSLIKRGIKYLTEMKKIRMGLENHYSAAQDFNRVEKNRKAVLEKIETLL